MAIKREKKAESNSLPEKLSKLLEKGFTEQFMSARFEELFKETKTEVVEYLENNEDGFDADLGKGFKCDQGTVIYTSRSTISVDKDKLIELVKSGRVSLEQVLATVSTFKNEDLEKTLSTPVFKEISTSKSSESLTFRGSAEFKAKLDEEFGSKPAPAPLVTKAAVSKEDAAAKAKAAEAVAKLAKKKASVSADADLDAILGGKK